MVSSITQISAPGLSEEQLQWERAWLQEFNTTSDSLDWLKWEKYWDNNAFLQFGNHRVEGKEDIAKYFHEQLGVLEFMQHSITRHSFDTPLGLIYQSADVIYKVKGDPQRRAIHTSGIGVIHKRVGSQVLTGLEIFIDKEAIAAIVQEVLTSK
ncbi:hypothetical protein CTheo_6548 [Ceratobasidium theobromae]|uniref:SnoaL-like domain-containing protein n=1 Tax=Ceratobasidium theobromae TaxID=1582974 RepID=A0A5N5QES9_9AGAM|nr:hypothetical protein CTheo_6548 [Ceratobasidium theobromae]